MKSNLFHFYFAAFFAGAFLGAELFGFAAFFGDADFFAGAFVDFGFVGVVAFFTLDVVDFFVDAFFVPTGLATLAFAEKKKKRMMKYCLHRHEFIRHTWFGFFRCFGCISGFRCRA